MIVPENSQQSRLSRSSSIAPRISVESRAGEAAIEMQIDGWGLQAAARK
jgi:hypothetical protein